ncbi:hypothetical protein QFC20_005784 [Naganishia adeliensis]|uniref:Uncharacterized protein n=1 Tax=Naganishia adeliensis TaxID=92952 RepID=A0ACC2VJD2_9TREE|nr:hypothetical protein QFC20_005784 [Naganishia adeliensis]
MPPKYKMTAFLKKYETTIIEPCDHIKGNLSPVMLLPYVDKFVASTFYVRHNLFLGNNKYYVQKGLVVGSYAAPPPCSTADAPAEILVSSNLANLTSFEPAVQADDEQRNDSDNDLGDEGDDPPPSGHHHEQENVPVTYADPEQSPGSRGIECWCNLSSGGCHICPCSEDEEKKEEWDEIQVV